MIFIRSKNYFLKSSLKGQGYYPIANSFKFSSTDYNKPE